LPGNFGGGIVMNVIYSAVFIFLSYWFSSRKLYRVKEKFENEEDVYVVLRKEEPNVLFIGMALLKSKLYNHLPGKDRFSLAGRIQKSLNAECFL
jgi:lysylphosphatidylglycerol synthetase-like protein (DUF2156 family)